MATAARLDIGAWRYETCVRRIRVVGQDLTDADLFMEIRLAPDTPGDPLIGLSKTPNGVGNAIRFIGLEDGASVVTSIVEITISGGTMASAAALPYAGEVGDNAVFAYAIRFGGTTRIYGSFVALAAVVGANSAPSSRPSSGSGASGASGLWGSATATFTGDEITLTIDGLEALAPLLSDAEKSADRAEAAVATVAEAVADIENIVGVVADITAGGQPVDPRDFELWLSVEGAVRLVITSDDYLVKVDSAFAIEGEDQSGVTTLADITALPGPVIASRDIVAVGDSFAEGLLAEETAKAYGPMLGLSATAIKAYNLGYSSHTSMAVATRINALAANYKPAGGVIPSGTDLFELIPQDTEQRAGPVQIFGGGTGGRAAVYYGRVECEFLYDSDYKPKLRRRFAGKAIDVPDFIPLVCIPYAQNITPKTAIDFWRDLTVIINCGRNNIGSLSAAFYVAQDTVTIKAIIDTIRPWGRRILLNPIWPQRDPGGPGDEALGSAQRAKVDAINANRVALWPEYYVDTLTPAINGYDVAAGDRVADFNAGYPARSYRLKYAADGVTVIEDALHAGNYVTPGRLSGQQLEGKTNATALFQRYY